MEGMEGMEDEAIGSCFGDDRTDGMGDGMGDEMGDGRGEGATDGMGDAKWDVDGNTAGIICALCPRCTRALNDLLALATGGNQLDGICLAIKFSTLLSLSFGTRTPRKSA